MPNLASWLLYEVHLNWQHLVKLNTWMLNTGAAVLQEFIENDKEITDAMDLLDSNPLRLRFPKKVQWARDEVQRRRDHRWRQAENHGWTDLNSAPNLKRKALLRQWQAWGWKLMADESSTGPSQLRQHAR